MPLNKSKGNMYNWVTHTWNTVKGECPHGCHYCYMKRWGDQKPVRFVESELKTDLGSRNTIFVGSSCDMWAKGIPHSWIRKTLNHCCNHTSTYLFQSKNSKRILELSKHLPAKTIVATTIETNRNYKEMGCAPPVVQRAQSIKELHHLEFGSAVTIEPIMDFDLWEMINLIVHAEPEWVNIGANTKSDVKLPEPSPDKVSTLIHALKRITKVKLKPNLKRLQ